MIYTLYKFIMTIFNF